MRAAIAIVLTLLISLAVLAEPSTDDKLKARKLLKEGRMIEFGSVWSHLTQSEEKRAKKAIPKYTAAIKLWPQFGDAYAYRALAYRAMEQLDLARSDARNAVKYPLDDTHSLSLLSFLFESEEQRQFCRTSITKVKAGDFEHEHLWMQIAMSYWYDGNFKACAREWEALIAYGFEEPQETNYSLLASTYEALGDYAQAEKIYRKILPGSALDIVQVRMRTGDFDGGLTLLAKYASSISKRDQLCFGTALRLLSGQPAPRLKEAMAEAYQDESGYSTFLYGLFLLADGQKSEALEQLQSFIDECEGNPREWGVTMRWEIAQAKKMVRTGKIR